MPAARLPTKIIAVVARKFICVADESRQSARIGAFLLPVEVIRMARSYVARELVKLGCRPMYRQSFVTDNGNHIFDADDVVTNGLCARRGADVLLAGDHAIRISRRYKNRRTSHA